MYDEYGDDYDEDISSDMEFCHSCGDFYADRCSGKNTGKVGKMSRIKVIEVVLRAVSALIAVGLAAIRFVKYIDKLQPARA